ncbi:sensor histidine kinase [Amnibacterium endophyticum]|uniref:Sensor-like histidine kinase SenX3 n=1 Tax=Amnibacterium endophyticum TaxID=2109337 RepID=A0ABW4LF60_9MICO
MSTAELVVLALGLGLLFGVAFTLLLRTAVDAGAAALDVQSTALPDGASAVIDALVEPAVVVDGSNTVLQATEGAVQMDLVHGRALAHLELDRLADEARSALEPRRADLALPRVPSGPRTLQVAAHAAPIDLGRVLLVVEDRSDAVRLEAMRRDFVANVSHELKTPIGAVSLLAEALDTAAEDPERVRRFAARLSAESARLGALVQEILAFTRLQDTDPLADARPVALDDVIAAAADRNRVAADAHSVAVVVGKRTGLHTRGDAAQLTTAVQNLVANAVAFAPPRTHVGIGLRARDGVVEIAVSDQGQGIPEEEQDRVFERFYRGDQSRTRQTGGSGLGLSIVKHVAENHGGDVRVWSRPGRGSTFTIRLPEEAVPVVQRPRRREKERT